MLVAGGAPPGWTGPHRPDLAPGGRAVRAYKHEAGLAAAAGDTARACILQERFAARYREDVLARLDPAEVRRQLEEAVAPHEPLLACYEAPGEFCHRRILAAWLEEGGAGPVPEDDAWDRRRGTQQRLL